MSLSNTKRRLDQLLTELWPDLSRNRIQAEIMAGNILVNGFICNKPGTMIKNDSEITLIKPENPFVSRGGLKLEGALEDLSINVKDLVVLDVGASTGGFSDCLLKKGARLIYALDVGYGQLASSLRNDPRVTVMERFNIRHLEQQDLPQKPNFAVVDVSFISLSKVLPVIAKLKIPTVLALVKPQFEAGRADASRGGGVIRDPAVHRQVLNKIIIFACQTGYCFRGITFSKWPGPKGNIEYFIYFTYKNISDCVCLPDHDSITSQIVGQAHQVLAKKKI